MAAKAEQGNNRNAPSPPADASKTDADGDESNGASGNGLFKLYQSIGKFMPVIVTVALLGFLCSVVVMCRRLRKRFGPQRHVKLKEDKEDFNIAGAPEGALDSDVFAIELDEEADLGNLGDYDTRFDAGRQGQSVRGGAE